MGDWRKPSAQLCTTKPSLCLAGANEILDNGPDKAVAIASCNFCLTLYRPRHDGPLPRKPEENGSRCWEASIFRPWSKSRGAFSKYRSACGSPRHFLRSESISEYDGRRGIRGLSTCLRGARILIVQWYWKLVRGLPTYNYVSTRCTYGLAESADCSRWEGDNYMLTQQVARYVRFCPFTISMTILI